MTESDPLLILPVDSVMVTNVEKVNEFLAENSTAICWYVFVEEILWSAVISFQCSIFICEIVVPINSLESKVCLCLHGSILLWWLLDPWIMCLTCYWLNSYQIIVSHADDMLYVTDCSCCDISCFFTFKIITS